jgi:hypothetical protein
VGKPAGQNQPARIAEMARSEGPWAADEPLAPLAAQAQPSR